MRAGVYNNGEKTLRAKIDMASPNINMRDPVLYRIMKISHHQTKDKWCIYPMYDFAHPLQDSFEGITHSLCSLEYEDHRPLYDWVINVTEVPHKPRQIEFGRLGITNTIMSKRYLKQLVDEKLVVPLNCLLDTIFKHCFRQPAKFGMNLCRVNSITHIVTFSVCHVCD